MVRLYIWEPEPKIVYQRESPGCFSRDLSLQGGYELCGNELWLTRQLCLLLAQLFRHVDYFNVLGQTKSLEDTDAVIIQINLIPRESMACRDGMSVVVVVPSLAESHHCYPPVVGGIVLGDEATATPHVSGRVHQPSRMQADCHAEEDPPHHIRPAANREQNDTESGQRDPMPRRQPDVNSVTAKIRSIALQLRVAVVQDFPAHNPSHMRPPTAVARTVRIPFTVAGLMMDAVCAHPEDRSAFEGQGGANGQEIFEPFRNLVSTMR